MHNPTRCLRLLLVAASIPNDRLIAATEIVSRLAAKGYSATLRSVQRDLADLRKFFPEALRVKAGASLGYRWMTTPFHGATFIPNTPTNPAAVPAVFL